MQLQLQQSETAKMPAETYPLIDLANYRQQQHQQHLLGRRKQRPTKLGAISRYLSLALVVLVVVFYSGQVYQLLFGQPAGQPSDPGARLKLVSVFTRHGDRAANNDGGMFDRFLADANYLWPRGLGNLTDNGMLRMVRLGTHLRRQYRAYLDFEASQIVALSSSFPRCIESLELMLRSLMNPEITKSLGFKLVGEHNCSRCLPSVDNNNNNKQLRVLIDSATLPALTWQFLDTCAYRQAHPSAIDDDLWLDPEVQMLPGVGQLADLMRTRFGLHFNFTLARCSGDFTSLLSVQPTTRTVKLIDFFTSWVATPASAELNLLQVYEQLSILSHVNRLQGLNRRIQAAPLASSLIGHQQAALINNSDQKKKMVLYSSHDSVLFVFLESLGVISWNHSRPFDERLRDHKAATGGEGGGGGVAAMLAGLVPPEYGTSIKFELWQSPMSLQQQQPEFAYVNATVYFEEDPAFGAVHFEPIDLGSICRRQFVEQNPGAEGALEQDFYPADAETRLDTRRSCPFGLWKNITAHLMMGRDELDQLCTGTPPGASETARQNIFSF